MKPLVESILETFLKEKEGRQIEIVIKDLPNCNADPNLLKHVLTNLISNAIKYTRKCDKANIEIGSQTKDSTSIYYIKDNGTGFDMQYVNKLFKVFQRLHRAEDYEGTGIGLAIAERIISRHGGKIWPESEPGKGSTFYFTLEGAQHD